MTPLFGSSAHRKISAVIITDAAHGAISAHRATRRPGKRWLNSCASASDSSMVTPTTTTTQITVRNSTPRRSGSCEQVAVVPGPGAAEDEAVGADVLERRPEHHHDRPQHDHGDQGDRGPDPEHRPERPRRGAPADSA